MNRRSKLRWIPAVSALVGILAMEPALADTTLDGGGTATRLDTEEAPRQLAVLEFEGDGVGRDLVRSIKRAVEEAPAGPGPTAPVGGARCSRSSPGPSSASRNRATNQESRSGTARMKRRVKAPRIHHICPTPSTAKLSRR